VNKQEIIKFLGSHKQELYEKYGVTRIGLFGSYARGEAKEGSDIDIIIEQKTPDLFILGTIKVELEEEFGKKVDIIRLHDGIREFLKKRINRDSIYV